MSLVLEYGYETINIARVAHEANRAYCQAIGDYTQKPWALSPEWQKESVCKGVEYVRENPTAQPSDSHESWLAEKREQGWKWGAVKSPEKKEHPCMLPYHGLPDEQKAKDYIFLAVVKALLASPEE